MATFKGLILMVAIALVAVNDTNAEDTKIQSLCGEMSRGMSEDIKMDSDKAFDYAKSWIGKNSESFEASKLIKVWRAALEGEACTMTSWDNIELLTNCQLGGKLEVLKETIRSYAKNCLTAEHVSSKIGRTARMFATKVGILDGQFVKKYLEENPNGNASWDEASSSVALKDAIRRDFAKVAEEPRKAFLADSEAVPTYLGKKLFEPCSRFVTLYSNMVSRLELVCTLYEGGQEALVASLDKSARNVLARYRYCKLISGHESQFIDEVAREFA